MRSNGGSMCPCPVSARGALAALAVVVGAAFARGEEPAPDALPTETVLVGGKLFELELAVREADRTRGLMERREIPHNGGMLFVFADDEIRTFWMIRTLIDLDIAYLDASGVVTAVHTMRVEMPRMPGESRYDYEDRLKRYSSRLPARYALEFGAGVLGWLGVKPGDRIALDFDRLQELARQAARDDAETP